MASHSIYRNILRIPLLAGACYAFAFYFLDYYDACNIPQDILNLHLMSLGIGAVVALASYKRFDAKKINYLGHLGLRLSMSLILFSTVYYYMFLEKVPDVNLLAHKDSAFRDISHFNLQMLYDEMTPGIRTIQSYGALIALFLLLNRKTAVYGFGLLLPIFTYMGVSNLDPSCDINRIKSLTAICCLGLLPYLEPLYQYHYKGKPIANSPHPLFEESHLYKSLSLLKYFILIGFFVLNINKPNRYYKYYANNSDSPIKGAWVIKDVEFDKSSEKDYQTDTLLMAKRIYLTGSRYGKIKMNDTLSSFEYLVDPSNNQFELWNFNEYRKLDLKGKFEYLSADTIRFYGRNAKDKVEFTMVLDEGIKVEE